MKNKLILTVTISFLLFSCKKETTSLVLPIEVPVASSIQLNVAYGLDALQKMDIYLPEGRKTTTTKSLILIHGGSWISGDKSDFAFILDSLKKRLPDYAIINLNYRIAVSLTTTFPTQENDIKSAIDFIYNKRNEYVISDKFVLLGFSAGSHLALLQAYKNPIPKIKAVIDFFGPTDMVDMYNNPAPAFFVTPANLSQLFNFTTPSTNLMLYKSSSPINYVDAQSSPTLILHGTADTIVKIQQSIKLDSLLTAKAVVHNYFPYIGENHGWFGVTLTKSLNQMNTFLATNVQ